MLEFLNMPSVAAAGDRGSCAHYAS